MPPPGVPQQRLSVTEPLNGRSSQGGRGSVVAPGVSMPVHGHPSTAARTIGSGNKRCTDCFCCILLLVCMGICVALSVFGFTHGNPKVLERFVVGRDSHDRLCGTDAGVEKFKKVAFVLPVGSLPAGKPLRPGLQKELKAVCTSKCPEPTGPDSLLENSTAREVDLCPPDDAEAGLCAWYGGKTTQLGFYCVDLDVFIDAAEGGHWLQDLKVAGWRLAILPLVAVLLGFLYLDFMHRLGPVCIWVSLVVAILAPALLGAFVFNEAHIKANGGHVVNPIFDRVDVKDLKMISYGLWCLAGVMTLVTCCCCSTIRGIIAVLKLTTEFLREVPSQFLQPVVVGLVQLAFLMLWLAVFITVASIGVEEGKQQACVQAGNIYCLSWDTETQRYGLVFLVFMLYWVENWFHALSHFGTSYAVGAWYFAETDMETGSRKIAEGGRSCCDCRLTIRAFCHGLLRHPGSLAFGAFAVAFCNVLRLLLWWAEKKDEAAGNPLTTCIWRVVNCLAACMERFVEFVSEHAYVEIALRGFGFCAAARKSLSMTALHPGLFAMVGNVAFTVRAIGVCCVMAGTMYAAMLALVWFPPSGLTYPTAPLVVTAIAAFVIGEVMMHPISATARAALHCYVIDEEETRSFGGVGSSRAPQALSRLAEDHRDYETSEGQRRCCCFPRG
mmetsp:Transcript_34218/g.72880  ORF Transcript_34218/g.72880 Transcript_34218/m.72880 type:complete len:668 (-) Transcript_34218:428-2431(-)